MTSKSKNSTPRENSRKIDDYIVSETPESESDKELSDAHPTKKRKSKQRKHPKAKPRKVLKQWINSDGTFETNALDSSFNSDVSDLPKKTRKPKRFLYTSQSDD